MSIKQVKSANPKAKILIFITLIINIISICFWVYLCQSAQKTNQEKVEQKTRLIFMQDITAEEILAESEFKNLNEEQAKQVAEFVNTISTIFYSLYKQQYEDGYKFETQLNVETNHNYEPLKTAA
ncbi:MAG: hypothetical protein KF900_10135 [Bacteroidetes bacterium]|nr:hypothetical protein [Bacteroidota bacterium]